MLTLPSGERLTIPDNVRIILEVDSLAHATPATVSRCGMVWFSTDNITTDMSLERLYSDLLNTDVTGDRASDEASPAAQINFLNTVKSFIVSERTSSLVADALEFATGQSHVMEASRERLLHSFRALLVQGSSPRSSNRKRVSHCRSSRVPFP